MDKRNIKDIIDILHSAQKSMQARQLAKKAWAQFPHNGCAAYVSAVLALASVDVPMTLSAGQLATRLKKDRKWQVIKVGSQAAGDVGVCFDADKKIAGSDHVYFVVKVIDADKMLISDNQSDSPHERFASGKGKTPTEYFLRAT